MRRQEKIDRHPPIPCWFCFRPLSVTRVVLDGIILAREEERGGPERLYICPFCQKENLCEETLKGRWFTSPKIAVGLLDLLFSKLPGGGSEEVLQAISWYRENEERRRYFFLRDGDSRYMGKSILQKLWPWWGEGEKGRPKIREAPAAGKARPSGKGPATGPPPPGGPQSPPRGTGAERPKVVTPYEILGLSPGAGPEEIRRAFHRLAVLYHPDKVHHLGEEFRAMANEKFKELKEAYEALLRRT